MRTHLGKFLLGFAVAAFALLGAHSHTLAVDTFADWTGAFNTTYGISNYTVISPTSAGGKFQNQEFFVNDATQSHMHYLSDPTVLESLDFTKELHMKGKLTVNVDAPNSSINIRQMFFGWYNSTSTLFRIGLGMEAPTPLENGWVKFDFGYAATGVVGGNMFPFVTADGTTNVADHNGDLQSGAYPFTFDYVPGPAGVMKATVGNFYRDVGPVPNLANVATTLDRFGFMRRTATITDGTAAFDLVISDLTYTGGSAIGDANGDRIVNIFDINLVSAHWDEVGPEGDVNGDFAVNIFDINVISAYWTPTPGGAAPVPEPSSVVLAGLSLMGMSVIAIRKRRRSAAKN